MSQDNTMELLLAMELPQPQSQDYRIKRLSKICGQDVVFTLNQLTYNRVEQLRQLEHESDIHIVLAGVSKPDLRSPALMDKYGAATPAELVKKLLLPGEIEDLKRAIERLCGYRQLTIEQIKKKLTQQPDWALLFYLFRRKNILPEQFYRMSPGERLILAALAEAEIEAEK